MDREAIGKGYDSIRNGLGKDREVIGTGYDSIRNG